MSEPQKPNEISAAKIVIPIIALVVCLFAGYKVKELYFPGGKVVFVDPVTPQPQPQPIINVIVQPSTSATQLPQPEPAALSQVPPGPTNWTPPITQFEPLPAPWYGPVPADWFGPFNGYYIWNSGYDATNQSASVYVWHPSTGMLSYEVSNQQPRDSEFRLNQSPFVIYINSADGFVYTQYSP